MPRSTALGSTDWVIWLGLAGYPPLHALVKFQ
jgi:hypothetical protein